MTETTPKKSRISRKTLLIIGGGLAGLCVVCLVVSSLNRAAAPAAGSSNQINVQQTAVAMAGRMLAETAGAANAPAASAAAASQQAYLGAIQTVQAQPTAAPLQKGGQTRDNPLPGAQGADIGGNMLLTILTVNRPADQQVAAGNMFNPTPAVGLEYATVQIQVQCGKSANDKCTFYPSEIKSVGSDGQVHDTAFVVGVPNQMTEINYDFFGGSKITGVLVFLFTRGDSQVVLFHEPMFFGSAVYISLP